MTQSNKEFLQSLYDAAAFPTRGHTRGEYQTYVRPEGRSVEEHKLWVRNQLEEEVGMGFERTRLFEDMPVDEVLDYFGRPTEETPNEEG